MYPYYPGIRGRRHTLLWVYLWLQPYGYGYRQCRPVQYPGAQVIPG